MLENAGLRLQGGNCRAYPEKFHSVNCGLHFPVLHFLLLHLQSTGIRLSSHCAIRLKSGIADVSATQNA